MISNYCMNYYDNNLFASKSLFEVIHRGIELMSKNVNPSLLQAWQNYAISVLNLISNRYGLYAYSEYLTYISSLPNCSPYEQLTLCIQKLLDIANRLPKGI